MAEPNLKEFVEKAQIESNLSNTNDVMDIELSKEFLMELQKNIYHERFDEDVLDHIAKINEGEGKITTWEELIDKFFCKFYPNSYDGEDEMLGDRDNWGIDPLEFISRVNSSFENHRKVDGRTKKVLFHAWMNGSWNKQRVDDNILCSNDTTTDSFFKPYLKSRENNDIEIEGERSQTKRKCINSNLDEKVLNNTSSSNDEQPNKKDLAEKKSAMLVKYLQSRNLEVLES
nr:hypothetical protein [Tanacetum cinerariifolium]